MRLKLNHQPRKKQLDTSLRPKTEYFRMWRRTAKFFFCQLFLHLALLTEFPFKPLFVTSDLWTLHLLRVIIFTLNFQEQVLGIFLYLSIFTRWFFHFPLKVSFWIDENSKWWERRPFPFSHPDSSSVKFPSFLWELLPLTLQTSLLGLVLVNVC